MTMQNKLRWFALLVAIAMVMGLAVTVLGLNAIQSAVDTSYDKQVEIQGVTEIKASALSSIELDPTTTDTRKIFADAEQNVTKWSARLMPMFDDPSQQANFSSLVTQWGDYDSRSQQLITLAAHDPKAANDQVTALYHSNFQPFQANLEQFIGQLEQQTESARQHARDTHQQIFWGIVAALLLIALVVIGMIGWLARSLRTSLSSIQQSMQQVSDNKDFTLRAPVHGRDEIALTAQSFNRLLDLLQRNLSELQQGARGVASSSQQMKDATTEIHQAVAAQSQASTSAADSVNQVTVSVSLVADKTHVVKAQSLESSRLAEQGSETIAHTIADIRSISSSVSTASDAIARLGEQSSCIVGIVGVISDVADQTNLLALNAAIEAARAGEAGRGFAVVADEVRKLAERTAASTREIAASLDAMNQASGHAVDEMRNAESLVRQSVERADDTDRSMRQIGDSASCAAASVVEIDQAIDEQSRASGGIAQQIERIAQMAQQANVAAQHANQNAQDLHAQAARQIEILAQYRLS